MRKIVFASWNPKKAAEMQRMAPEGVRIYCLKDIPEAANVPQADENGATFLENATIKAKYWAEKLNMPVLAEDSGIVIDALNGYPGVYTKRCLEQLRPGANVNVDKPAELYPILLELMAESGNTVTTAHWTSAMAYIDYEKTVYAEEALHGNMCPCAGEREFGFDQYFKANGFNKTLSELEPKEKDRISPRKKAFENILTQVYNKYDFIIKDLLREDRWCYLALRALQEATEFKGKIPKSHFYKYDDYSFADYLGIRATKEEVRTARREIIHSIVIVIKSHRTYRGEKMLHDHYARLFHALAILKVAKNTDLLPGTLKDNFIYNAMYMLWRADDGSPNAEKGILSSAWFLSEQYKNLTEGDALDCIGGLKC